MELGTNMELRYLNQYFQDEDSQGKYGPYLALCMGEVYEPDELDEPLTGEDLLIWQATVINFVIDALTTLHADMQVDSPGTDKVNRALHILKAAKSNLCNSLGW